MNYPFVISVGVSPVHVSVPVGDRGDDELYFGLDIRFR